MGGCQNYGPFLGTLNIRGRIIIGTQKGIIILTTTHMGAVSGLEFPKIRGTILGGPYKKELIFGGLMLRYLSGLVTMMIPLGVGSLNIRCCTATWTPPKRP